MAAQNFMKLEQKRGSVSNRKTNTAHTVSSLDSATYVVTNGGCNSSRSLELVSKESFRQRLEGMSSSCLDCLTEHRKDLMTHSGVSAPATTTGTCSMQRLSKSNRIKRNSPIVVCLRESIRLAEAKSRARVSAALTNISHGRKAKDDQPMTKENEKEKFAAVSYSSSTSISPPLSSSGTHVPSHSVTPKPEKGSKNFNAFLSVVEKVHRKDNQPKLSVQNLSSPSYDGIQERQNAAQSDAFRESLSDDTVLNNKTLVGPGVAGLTAEMARTTFGEKNNVDVICNDLRSSRLDTHSGVFEDSDPSDSSCRHSSSESSDMEPEVFEEEHGLSKEELDRLSEHADGFAMRRYELPPHECPECLSAYFAYTHYYAQGSKFFKIEVLDRDEELCHCYSAPESTSDSIFECPPPTGRSSTGHHSDVKGRLKVNHIGQPNCHPLPPFPFHRHIDTVSLDLTGSDVTFTVEQHLPDTASVPPGAATHQPAAESHNSPGHPDYYHNFYCSMFGLVPCVPGYCFIPAVYFMFPIWSIPKPSMAAASGHQPPRAKSRPNVQEDYSAGLNSSFRPGPMTPPRRPWVPLNQPNTTSSVGEFSSGATANPGAAIYTVMCYNVLCDKYATRQLYGYCPSWALNWEFRKKNIFQEIRQYNADIINLQEVETEQFYDFFLPELKAEGYEGIFSPKSRARTMTEADRKHVDGCAIFFKHSKFSLIKEHLVEFNQVAIETAEGSEDMINRVMTKDNIGLAALLQTKDSTWENGVPAAGMQLLLVATCHIHWDPECCDVKLIQTMMLMNKLKSILEETRAAHSQRGTSASSPDCDAIPLILCGDLNSLPDSGVVEYLTLGKIRANHRDFKDIGYKDSLRKLSSSGSKDTYSHGFRLLQAYSTDVMPYTNYTCDFKGTIDYVFYSRDLIRPLGVLGPLDQEWFRQNQVVGCPNPQIPSDHLPLLVEFEMHLPPGAAPASASDIPAAPSTSSSSDATSHTPSTTPASSAWTSTFDAKN